MVVAPEKMAFMTKLKIIKSEGRYFRTKQAFQLVDGPAAGNLIEHLTGLNGNFDSKGRLRPVVIHGYYREMISKQNLEQFEELDIMNGMLPVSQKSKDRLYLCWRNEKGIECKMIGPETKCFCNHRFKEHEYLNPKGAQPYCKAPKCKCKCFEYIPAHGAYDFKCLCKHSYKEHDRNTKKCTNAKCKGCGGFGSAWTCSCGSKYSDHVTVVETYEERKAKGKTVNDMVRMGNQLSSAQEQGSLYKPVKQDPQARMMRAKRESMSLKMEEAKKISKFQEKQEQIEEFKLSVPQRRR